MSRLVVLPRGRHESPSVYARRRAERKDFGLGLALVIITLAFAMIVYTFAPFGFKP